MCSVSDYAKFNIYRIIAIRNDNTKFFASKYVFLFNLKLRQYKYHLTTLIDVMPSERN